MEALTALLPVAAPLQVPGVPEVSLPKGCLWVLGGSGVGIKGGERLHGCAQKRWQGAVKLIRRPATPHAFALQAVKRSAEAEMPSAQVVRKASQG